MKNFTTTVRRKIITLCSFEKSKPHFSYILRLEVSPKYMKIKAVNVSFDFPVHYYTFVNIILIFEEVLLIVIIFL